jgi:predicted CopG family antitoxin
MKTLHQTFTDEEFEKLQAKKGTKSWHDFIMELAK